MDESFQSFIINNEEEIQTDILDLWDNHFSEDSLDKKELRLVQTEDGFDQATSNKCTSLEEFFKGIETSCSITNESERIELNKLSGSIGEEIQNTSTVINLLEVSNIENNPTETEIILANWKLREGKRLQEVNTLRDKSKSKKFKGNPIQTSSLETPRINKARPWKTEYYNSNIFGLEIDPSQLEYITPKSGNSKRSISQDKKGNTEINLQLETLQSENNEFQTRFDKLHDNGEQLTENMEERFEIQVHKELEVKNHHSQAPIKPNYDPEWIYQMTNGYNQWRLNSGYNQKYKRYAVENVLIPGFKTSMSPWHMQAMTPPPIKRIHSDLEHSDSSFADKKRIKVLENLLTSNREEIKDLTNRLAFHQNTILKLEQDKTKLNLEKQSLFKSNDKKDVNIAKKDANYNKTLNESKLTFKKFKKEEGCQLKLNNELTAKLTNSQYYLKECKEENDYLKRKFVDMNNDSITLSQAREVQTSQNKLTIEKIESEKQILTNELAAFERAKNEIPEMRTRYTCTSTDNMIKKF